MRIRCLSLALFVMLAVPARWAGAAGTTGASFLQTNVSAAPAAQAAGAAGLDPRTALIWNPAVLGSLDIPSVSLTHYAALVDTAYEQVEGYYPGWLQGNWGIRLFYASTYQFTEVNELGEELGTLNNHDLLVHAAYARPLGGGWTVGGAIKVFDSALDVYQSNGAAVDLGVLYRTPWPALQLGASLLNLGGMSAFAEEADPLPLVFKAGAGYDWAVVGKHRVEFLADANVPLAGDENAAVNLGVRYRYNGLLVLRGGYRLGAADLGALSLGGGLRLGNWGMDYAFQPYSELGETHHVTLSYEFLSGEPEGQTQRDQNPPAAAAAPAPDQLTIQARPIEAGRVFLPGPEWVREAGAGHAWRLDLLDGAGLPIRALSGAGALPEKIEWDGLDQNGRPVLQTADLHCRLTAGGRSRDYGLPRMASIRMVQGDPEGLPALPVRVRFETRPPLKRWALRLWSRPSSRTLAEIQREGTLPAAWVWNRGDSRLSADQADLDAEYADGFRAILAEPVHRVGAEASPAPAGRQAICIPGILFDFDQAELRPDMGDKLWASADVLAVLNGAQAVCEGHADETGTEAYNQDLSKRRAGMVARFLTTEGNCSSAAVAAQGFGTSRPENRLGTEEGRARNRRVDIRLTWPNP